MTDPVSTHTAGPASFKVAANGDCGIVAPGTGVFIEVFADIRRAHEGAKDEARANAAFLVRAWNNFDGLVVMLRNVVAIFDNDDRTPEEMLLMEEARDLIAATEAP